MISICPHCGSSRWSKAVQDDHIVCPDCNGAWPLRRGPLLLLTGCSGVGKTTTAVHLRELAQGMAVLDGDMFYIPDDSQLPAMLEKVGNLSASLNQTGVRCLWTLTGGLDLLPQTYHYRFFSGVRCLALVCEPDELRRRMTQGRGITDEVWLRSSCEYNDYFCTHDAIGSIPFQRLDVTRLTPQQAAQQVLHWLNNKE